MRRSQRQPPYDPGMMTKVLVYGYCVGVYSARKIQQRLTEDVAFRVLAAGNEPDFRTIANFRKIRFAGAERAVRASAEDGLGVGGDEVGTGGAGRQQGEGEHLEAQGDELGADGEQEKAIQQQVKEMLAQAEAVDAEEDERAMGKRVRRGRTPG